MLVDGKKIAAHIYEDIKSDLENVTGHPCLCVITCAPNAETKKFLELKKKRAMDLGIDVLLTELDPSTTTEEVVRTIEAAVDTAEGIVVQLPFPPHIDTGKILSVVPKMLDVDAISYRGEKTDILPPVVGAIAAIAREHDVDFSDQRVVVVGRGRLVGQPAAFWARAENGVVTVLDRDTPNADGILRQADIIISGAGVPGLITPDKIKDGVIIFDAGTSEEGGQIKGDADPACADKAALFTPVPGGIGPITIAVLLRNLVLLTEVCSKTETWNPEPKL